MKVIKLASLFLIIGAIITLLIITKDILIPLILAVIIWFIVKEIRNFFDKADWIKQYIPRWIKTSLASVLVFGVISFSISILASNINELKNSIPIYENNVEHVAQLINTTFSIDIEDLFADFFVDFDFSEIIKDIVNSISTAFGTVFMILIYVLFIFMEESASSNKLKYIYSTPQSYEEAKALLTDIDRSISSYITLKTLVSLITGTLSYFVLLIIGIDVPLFWAFLIFLLNFIPTIGSLIATLFPTVIALLQFGEFTPSLLILTLVGAIQVVVGNILEPKIVGNSLNVSSLVVILSLTIWGNIWGVFGMVISVPITVILIIILSRFESTKNIAILLSEKGKINELVKP